LIVLPVQIDLDGRSQPALRPRSAAAAS
jgi:hypothetical protein